MINIACVYISRIVYSALRMNMNFLSVKNYIYIVSISVSIKNHLSAE